MTLPLLKFALTGCGRIGATHAKLMAEKGELVAVCDTDLAKAEKLASVYGVKSYPDQGLMLLSEEIDLVAVCTPNGLHATHSVEALNHQMHVLCEKPMALKTDDCVMMMDAADQNARHLFVVKQNRYNPPVIALKQLLDEKKLGRIYSLHLNCFWNRDAAYYKNSWKGSLELDGGTLFTQFSHFIDLLLWLFGDVDSIQSTLANLGHKGLIETEDTGAAILKFRQGILATVNYTVNSFRKNMEGSLTVFGENGTVKIGGQYLNKLEYAEIHDYKFPEITAGQRANDYGDYIGSMSNHDKVYDNVIAVLNGSSQIHTTSYQALKTVELINRIYVAAQRFS